MKFPETRQSRRARPFAVAVAAATYVPTARDAYPPFRFDY